MKYQKPTLTTTRRDAPPLAANFAPPPAEQAKPRVHSKKARAKARIAALEQQILCDAPSDAWSIGGASIHRRRPEAAREL